jgi:hypothetical protein
MASAAVSAGAPLRTITGFFAVVAAQSNFELLRFGGLFLRVHGGLHDCGMGRSPRGLNCGFHRQ